MIKLTYCTCKLPVSVNGILVTHLKKEYNNYYGLRILNSQLLQGISNTYIMNIYGANKRNSSLKQTNRSRKLVWR